MICEGIQQSNHSSTKSYTAPQESARKDIEQAFGVLQSCFKVMEYPILCHSLSKMGTIVQCVLIIHNMSVSNWVMGGDVHARYDPFASINRENGYDINEQIMMNNQDGSDENTVNIDNASREDNLQILQ